MAKASFTTTTMSFINTVFEKADLDKPFGVAALAKLKPTPTGSSTIAARVSNKPHRNTKLYQVLLSKFSIDTYGSTLLEEMAVLMHEMMFYDAKDMLLISFKDFRECVEAHVEKRKASKEQKVHIECPPVGVLSAVWQATRTTTSTKTERVVSDLLLPEDLRLTQTAFERDVTLSTP